MPRGVPQYTESAALTFGAATGDRIDCGSATLLDDMTALSLLAWVYPTTISNGRGLISKNSGGAGWSLSWRSTGDLDMQWSRATTNLRNLSSSAQVVVNKWQCLAAICDQTVVRRNYEGTQFVPLSEVTSYHAASTDGSGAFSSDAAATVYVGNSSTGSPPTLALQGSISVAAVFNRVLSLTELRAWQFSALDEPFPAIMHGCVGLWYPGLEGAAGTIDYSGYNNTGTVTGATLSRGVALLYRDPVVQDRRRFISPAAAAATYGYNVLSSPIFDGRVLA